MKLIHSYRVQILFDFGAISTTYIQGGLKQAESIAWQRVKMLRPGERVEVHDMNHSQRRVFLAEY